MIGELLGALLDAIEDSIDRTSEALRRADRACDPPRADVLLAPQGGAGAASSIVVVPELLTGEELHFAALDLSHPVRKLVIPGGGPFRFIELLAAELRTELGALVLAHLGNEL